VQRKRKIQIKTLENLQKANAKEVQQRLDAIQDAAIKNENLFDHLMEPAKVVLGQVLLLFWGWVAIQKEYVK
jgi:methylmalonyl-CoA mutase